jgi:hypothetical protein
MSDSDVEMQEAQPETTASSINDKKVTKGNGKSSETSGSYELPWWVLTTVTRQA